MIGPLLKILFERIRVIWHYLCIYTIWFPQARPALTSAGHQDTGKEPILYLSLRSGTHSEASNLAFIGSVLQGPMNKEHAFKEESVEGSNILL
jgi:hypothetical protein